MHTNVTEYHFIAKKICSHTNRFFVKPDQDE